MNTFETTLGRAIDLLRHGYSLPFSVRRALVEEGYDPAALTAAHLGRI